MAQKIKRPRCRSAGVSRREGRALAIKHNSMPTEPCANFKRIIPPFPLGFSFRTGPL